MDNENFSYWASSFQYYFHITALQIKTFCLSLCPYPVSNKIKVDEDTPSHTGDNIHEENIAHEKSLSDYTDLENNLNTTLQLDNDCQSIPPAFTPFSDLDPRDFPPNNKKSKKLPAEYCKRENSQNYFIDMPSIEQQEKKSSSSSINSSVGGDFYFVDTPHSSSDRMLNKRSNSPF